MKVDLNIFFLVTHMARHIILNCLFLENLVFFTFYFGLDKENTLIFAIDAFPSSWYVLSQLK